MTFLLFLAATAFSHHDTAITQVAPPQLSTPSDETAPYFSLGLSSDTAYFGTTRRGSQPLLDAQETETWLQLWSLTAATRLKTGTGLRITLPVGLLANAQSTTAGLGDLSAEISQVLGPVMIGVTASAPTGRYTPYSVLSALDLSVGDSGSLTPTLYDTQANLGLGTWSVGWSLSGRFQKDAWSLTIGTQGHLPLGSTDEGAHWGPTLSGYLTPRLRLASPVSVALGADISHHFSDSFAPSSGDPLTKGGRRTLVSAHAGGEFTLTDALQLHLLVHVPVWSEAQGVQLVETVTARLGCEYRWSLTPKVQTGTQ